MTTQQMKQFLLAKSGLTPDERKEIQTANDATTKDLFEVFKKHKAEKDRKLPSRFTDNFF